MRSRNALVFTGFVGWVIWVGVAHGAGTRVAIVPTAGADARARDVAAAAEAELGANERFSLIERQQVERVLSEQKLSLSGATDAAQAVRAGKLLACQMLVLLEPERRAGGAVGVVIFDPSTGVRLFDAAVPTRDGAKAAEALVAAVVAAADKRQNAGAMKTVCLMTVRNADLPRDMDGFCDGVGRLVERSLVGSSSIALLERSRLEQVTRERALADDPALKQLMASVVVMELDVARDNAGLRATALLSDNAGKPLGKAGATARAGDAPGLSAALAGKLAGELKAPPPAKLDPLAEAARFFREWEFRQGNDDLLRAVAPAEAAHALAPDDLVYEEVLARALIESGNRAFHDLNFGPHTGRERPDWVPPAMIRGAQMLSDVVPRTPRADEQTRAVLRDHRLTALARLRGFISSATWFAVGGTDRTPLPTPDLAAVKSSLRRCLLAENAELLAGARARAGFEAYSAHVAQLLEENEWLYSNSPQQWMGDYEQTVGQWLALHEKFPDDTSPDVVAALDVIAVLWNLADHPGGGGGLYNRSTSQRTRRWDPDAQGYATLERTRDRLKADRVELVRWYGSLCDLSIRVARDYGMPERIDEAVGKYLQATRQTLERADLAARPDLRLALYHMMVEADRLLDATPLAGRRSGELFDLCLSRKEIVPIILDRSARIIGGRSAGDANADHTRRRMAALRRVLEVLNAPGAQVLSADGRLTVADATAGYRRELDRYEDLQPRTSPPATTGPAATADARIDWYDRRTLLDLVKATSGVLAVYHPMSDGTAVYAAGAQPMGTSPMMQTVRLQLLQIPLGGGTPRGLGMLPTRARLEPRMQNGRFQGDSAIVTGACMGSGVYCAATFRDGVFVFPLDGKMPWVLDERRGLPTSSARAVTILEGRVYAALGADGAPAFLVSCEPSGAGMDVLASGTRKDKRSPLDDENFRIVDLQADAARKRLIVTVVRKQSSEEFDGLWEYVPSAKKWRHLVAVHLFQQQNDLRTGGRGVNISRAGRASEDVVTVGIGAEMFFYDLAHDRPFRLFPAGGATPYLPATTPRWPAVTDAGAAGLEGVWRQVPVNAGVLEGNWLWGRWGRVELTSGQVQKLDRVRDDFPNGPLTIEPVRGTNHVLVSDRQGLWLLTPKNDGGPAK